MNSQQLLQLYRSGQSAAASEIFDRYVARLIELARQRIAPRLRRRIDPEDVVQSAYRSFFVHAKADGYSLAERGDLWRLLASITLHKLHHQIERQTAAKRNVAHEEQTPFAPGDLQAPNPTPVEVIAAVEELQMVLKSLKSDEQRVLASLLKGMSIEEMSISIGKSTRTVRRIIATITQKFELRLLTPDSTTLREPHHIVANAPLQYTDYTLKQLLAAGGMGKVFRAVEKSSGRQVAIKALHKSRQTDRRAVEQFVQEAQVLNQLRHPNIVPLHGLGRFPSGNYFMVMDFVNGEDVQSRLRHGRLTLEGVVHIMRSVVAAVQFAHDRGVIHCDLKPANVLIDVHNQVFVTDFGFAYLTRGAQPLRKSIGGTAGYIAPEVLAGHAKPTPAADIYALGTLLRTLMTEAPTTANGLLPSESLATGHFAAIWNRCRAHDPARRYQCLADLIHDLERTQAQLPDALN